MFLLFTARCPRCGNTFKAEAEEWTEPSAATDCAFTCPRCYTAGRMPASDGTPSDTPTPWAVRAAAAERSV
jgi:hypothetical protein